MSVCLATLFSAVWCDGMIACVLRTSTSFCPVMSWQVMSCFSSLIAYCLLRWHDGTCSEDIHVILSRHVMSCYVMSCFSSLIVYCLLRWHDGTCYEDIHVILSSHVMSCDVRSCHAFRLLLPTVCFDDMMDCFHWRLPVFPSPDFPLCFFIDKTSNILLLPMKTNGFFHGLTHDQRCHSQPALLSYSMFYNETRHRLSHFLLCNETHPDCLISITTVRLWDTEIWPYSISYIHLICYNKTKPGCLFNVLRFRD